MATLLRPVYCDLLYNIQHLLIECLTRYRHARRYGHTMQLTLLENYTPESVINVL